MAPALSDRRRAHCRTSLPPASGIASVSDRMFDFGGEALHGLRFLTKSSGPTESSPIAAPTGYSQTSLSSERDTG